MIRQIFTEILLFCIPFAVYAVFLFATRKGVLHPEAWNMRVLGWLTAAALLLMIGGFAYLAQHSGHPVGMNYIPPHMENGKLIPGQFK